MRKRVIDQKVMKSILYMHGAARTRGMKDVGLPMFVYAILISCREYVENCFGQAAADDALSALSLHIFGDGSDDREIPTIPSAPSFNKKVSAIILDRMNGGSVITCLFDAMLIDKEVHDILTAAGVNINDVQNGVSNETMESSRLKRETAAPATQPAGADLRKKRTKSRSSAESLPRDKEDFEFYVDLVERAREGKLAESYGRDVETSHLILTLLRKVKGNPLLVGEPGVGKTAIVERLARMIVDGEVPARLSSCTIYSVDIPGLMAGTSLRGMLEQKLRTFMEEVGSRRDVILFFDEIHMAVGSDGGHTSSDIANMIKPYLARGDVRCIGATTIGDFNKFMRKDGAFCRRFQRINVSEMTPDQTSDILHMCKESYEDFHGVSIADEAIASAVSLSARYIVDRRFPDKALDCIDDACARASIYDCKVDSAIVEESVSAFSMVPLNVVRSKDADKISEARDAIPTEILGNDQAIDDICATVSRRIRSKAKRNRVLCSMIVHGPNGVGKKTCVRLLAESLYGPNSVLEINGNDYAESHSVSSIIGAPAGYVGYDDDGRLYSNIRKRPTMFILVSNFGSMHPLVRLQLVRIMRNGIVEDIRGLPADFRNAVMVFCTDDKTEKGMGFGSVPTTGSLERSVWAGILDEVDAVIPFGNVSMENMKRIAWMEAARISEEFDEWESPDIGDAVIASAYERCADAANPADMCRKMRSELEKMAVHTA
jgi:ATP-dependent Clp protease ATP-binding subunit ClpA